MSLRHSLVSQRESLRSLATLNVARFQLINCSTSSTHQPENRSISLMILRLATSIELNSIVVDLIYGLISVPGQSDLQIYVSSFISQKDGIEKMLSLEIFFVQKSQNPRLFITFALHIKIKYGQQTTQGIGKQAMGGSRPVACQLGHQRP